MSQFCVGVRCKNGVTFQNTTTSNVSGQVYNRDTLKERRKQMRQKDIDNFIELGVLRERQRIIKLIEENTMTMTSPLDNSVMRSLRMSPSELIALIKGENNE